MIALLLAAAAPGAEAFLRRVYAPYQAGSDASASTDDATVYAPSLIALISRDADVTPRDEVPWLNGDPLCDCQDRERLRDLTVAVRPAGAHRATATVRFRNGSEARRLTLTLLATRRGWRVADIAAPSEGSLAAALRRDIAKKTRR